MIAFLTVVLIVSAIFLIIVILMQQGKGQEMGAVFGGSSQTVFGASGAGNFLTKTTAVLAVIFLGSAFLISYISAKQVAPISIKHYLSAKKTSAVGKKNEAKKTGSLNISKNNKKTAVKKDAVNHNGNSTKAANDSAPVKTPVKNGTAKANTISQGIKK
jgi:preprotein translocase subunit SecG